MQRKKRKKVTVGFISLGCPKNSVDSERMLAEIAQAGFVITAEPDTADVVVINTCGFIAPAKAESLEAIRHAVEHKLSGAIKKVIVAGCLPEREGQQLFNQVDGIDAVVGLGQRDNIAGIIKKTLSHRHPAAYLEQSAQTIPDDRTRLLITPSHWAYLRISEGCNHRCSFCTIPAIRGRFRSKPPELVLSEAGELVSAGVVELNIIAQDSTSYGRDLKIKNSLAGLISELEKITGLSWIRLMYLYPTEIDDKLIETIAESEKIVHYLDIPIQHVNNKILKAMRRPDSKDQLKRLIEKLRGAMPDIVLRTTVIVGFPGESDQQFVELLDFIKWAQFDALGSFKFYAESGTAAAQMPNQVSEKIKQKRLEELMLTQQKIAFTKNKNRIGSQLTCLVDCVENKDGKGRFYGQAPDIDSICIIKNCQARPGEFINAKVIATKEYDLLVEQI
ncbi:MAG: 30S ribosomal protein S12 methylthiotransferase RimO [Planctomycetes bacterium]|nr:30S ribosomal protein S12 methylthiotransferase RimO [Planctomycetota bacterium]